MPQCDDFSKRPFNRPCHSPSFLDTSSPKSRSTNDEWFLAEHCTPWTGLCIADASKLVSVNTRLNALATRTGGTDDREAMRILCETIGLTDDIIGEYGDTLSKPITERTFRKLAPISQSVDVKSAILRVKRKETLLHSHIMGNKDIVTYQLCAACMFRIAEAASKSREHNSWEKWVLNLTNWADYALILRYPNIATNSFEVMICHLQDLDVKWRRRFIYLLNHSYLRAFRIYQDSSQSRKRAKTA